MITFVIGFVAVLIALVGLAAIVAVGMMALFLMGAGDSAHSLGQIIVGVILVVCGIAYPVGQVVRPWLIEVLR